jgi:Ni,Fe-hydrogenase I cytochrome b subunit
VWRHNPLDVWNYFASLLAIVIESTVGIAMFSQTLRDAVKLRAVEKRIIQLEAKIDTLLARYE